MAVASRRTILVKMSATSFVESEPVPLVHRAPLAHAATFDISKAAVDVPSVPPYPVLNFAVTNTFLSPPVP